MKDLDIFVFLSVFQEMLGTLLWVLLALAAVILALFLAVLIRDRGLSYRRFVRAELVGLVGGILAVLFMQQITSSRLSDLGGPVDVMLVALIWIAGAIGTTLVAYLAQSYQKP